MSIASNAHQYRYVHAWNDGGNITGDWPGQALSEYDSNWLVYDFDSLYTEFRVIFNNGNGAQSGYEGDLISGFGAYWFYRDALVKADSMPDLTSSSTSTSYDPDVTSLPSNPGEGNIFHAFDWSLQNIKNNLSAIANAGYTAIQTSPLQRPKDHYGNDSNGSWWKLYQPFSFDLPSDNYYLGNGNDLTQLTNAAHNLGLSIIVDVVANHMGGDGDSISSGASAYERDICNNQEQTVHHNGQCSNWNDRWAVTHQRIGGYPDLNTDNSIVQGAVYDYLKELIDHGVDGFRFDAAKHIETPFDADNIRSEFWHQTATRAYTYAEGKGKSLFMYGEILDNCGGVPFTYYTALLDAVTDNQTGNDILAAIESNSVSGAAKADLKSGLDAEDVVLWGESHDTYMNTDGSSRNSDQADVDKAYALVGVRKASRSLYFARPNKGASLGSGATQNDNYKGTLVRSVNTLKVAMGNNDEHVGSSGNVAYVERYGANGYGASLVNVNGSNQATVELPNLPDGNYKDLVSGSTYTLSDGMLNVTFNGSLGATVIQKI